MVLSEKRTKNLMERIKAQNQRGYTIDRKAPRKQRTKFVLPMNALSLRTAKGKRKTCVTCERKTTATTKQNRKRSRSNWSETITTRKKS